MAEFKNPSNRVFGKTVGKMTEGSKPAGFNRFLTDAQRAENQRQTEAAYQVWKAQRDARIANSRTMRVRELRHKDIIM
jgi:hypothetical protein